MGGKLPPIFCADFTMKIGCLSSDFLLQIIHLRERLQSAKPGLGGDAMNNYRPGSHDHAEYMRGRAAAAGAIAGGMAFPRVIPRGWSTAFRNGFGDVYAEQR